MENENKLPEYVEKKKGGGGRNTNNKPEQFQRSIKVLFTEA
jgi:hypothetical protein